MPIEITEYTAYTVAQAGRPLTATTPLGGDVLVPVAVEGTEAVSAPFLFTVDFVSANPSIAPADLLGKPVGLSILRPDESVRPVHGLVRRFSNLGLSGTAGLTRYRAELVPWLWMLSLSTDSRTYENMSALDIVEDVCRRAGFTAFRRSVTAAPAAEAYVVQYGETALDFVSRLLERAGLYYWFEHTASAHTLVFSDAKGTTIPAGALATVNVVPIAQGAQPLPETVQQAVREYAMHAKEVALGDAHLLRAPDSGTTTSSAPGALGKRVGFLGDLSGTASAGISTAEATRWIEREEWVHDRVRGRSTCPTFLPGSRTTIKGGPLGTSGVELHLLRVQHFCSIGDVVSGGSAGDFHYENEFEAIPATTPFRPPCLTRPPRVHGTQTALVVGSAAGEPDVDANGCVLLQFPWDQGAGKDGASQHRVHVAALWAGAGWGAIHHPRVGQRVLVEYLDGDPERPIVTGRVYSHEHAHPYANPANKTQSGIKSRSVGEGAGADTFNELRFEDKKGNEHVYLQAEKDLQVKVKNDETRDVLHDRTTTIKNADTRTVQEGDDTHTVSKGNQSVTVSKGNQAITVSEGNQTIDVAKGNQTITVGEGHHALTVSQGNHTVEVAQGDQTITVGAGSQQTTVHADRGAVIETGNDELTVNAGNLTITVKQGNIAIKANLGSIAIEAMNGITLTCGGSSIEVGTSGVTMKGATATIEGQGKTDVKGAQLNLQGQAMASLKGAMVQVSGDAMLQAKGGVTMIG